MQSQPVTVGFVFWLVRQRFAALAERANLATEWEWHNRFGENYLLEKSIIFRVVADISCVFSWFGVDECLNLHVN